MSSSSLWERTQGDDRESLVVEWLYILGASGRKVLGEEVRGDNVRERRGTVHRLEGRAPDGSCMWKYLPAGCVEWLEKAGTQRLLRSFSCHRTLRGAGSLFARKRRHTSKTSQGPSCINRRVGSKVRVYYVFSSRARQVGSRYRGGTGRSRGRS